MQYYQCDKYPIEFVLSENIDKHFDSHNHAGHYVTAVVLQGTVTVCLENREAACDTGDVFIIPPFAVHSVCQGRDARLLSVCIGTAFIEETDREAGEAFFKGLLEDVIAQGVFGEEQGEKLLTSMRTVYHFRDHGRKEMDAGIKILADEIVRHPEQFYRRCRMDTFELFNNGKLVLPEKEAGFAEIAWSKHPTFKGVELKHIITATDTDGTFSYHLVRIAPGCSIGNHIHETQLETHEVIKGSGKCVNAGSVILYEPGTISIMQAGAAHEVTAGSEGLYLFAKFMPALFCSI